MSFSHQSTKWFTYQHIHRTHSCSPRSTAPVPWAKRDAQSLRPPPSQVQAWAPQHSPSWANLPGLNTKVPSLISRMFKDMNDFNFGKFSVLTWPFPPCTHFQAQKSSLLSNDISWVNHQATKRPDLALPSCPWKTSCAVWNCFLIPLKTRPWASGWRASAHVQPRHFRREIISFLGTTWELLFSSRWFSGWSRLILQGLEIWQRNEGK